jgi:hypothetical protein
MTIDADLFRAILAMDVYNRGTGSGIGPTLTGLGYGEVDQASVSLISPVCHVVCQKMHH